MIRNLKDQTLKNTEQDWLKTNLAKFTRMLQGERDLATVSNLILSEIAPLVNAQRGVFYMIENDGGEPVLDLVASYAFHRAEEHLEPLPHAPGAGWAMRLRAQAHPAHQRAGATTSPSARRWARRRPSTSSCCRCSSSRR
jgi:GAF domain-containing protein